MKFVKQIPNIVTGIRIAAAIVLIFIEPLSLPYLIIYGVCGLSDALDGFLARKLKATSKFGSVIDSISDIVFYSVMVGTLFPTILDIFGAAHLTMAAVALAMQVAAYIVCAIKFRKFSAIHTYLNKVQGLFFFGFPFSLIGLNVIAYNTYYFIGASIALLAGLEILLIHCVSKTYDERNKSIFLLKRNQKEIEEQSA